MAITTCLIGKDKLGHGHGKTQSRLNYIYLDLASCVRPHISRKTHGDVQPDAHQGEQYHIYKVSSQNVVSNGKGKKRIRCCWSECALN